MQPFFHALTAALAFASAGFHLALIFSGLVPNLVSRPLHLALMLPWVFVIGRKGGWTRLLDLALCIAGLAAIAFILLNRTALEDQYGALEGLDQRILAVVLIGIVIEMARRAVRLALPVVAVLALAYGLFGQHLPGEFGHPGLPFDSLMGTLVIAEGGLWGPLTGVSTGVVAVFVILGAVIATGEGGEAFMALATRMAGRLRAGAAKVSVLASALFGSISGSASANVASTGAVTLPAMKRLGYPPSFAAAVEATASTGGQIMPPLMGAGAFIMAELLGQPYTTIMTAALLPSLLFFLAVWLGVDLFAARIGLQAMAREDIPAPARVLRLAPFFLLPFGLLLLVLFGSGRTPQFAAALAIFAAAGLLLVDDRWRPSLRRWGRRLSAAMITAARQTATIASIIICAGIVIGVLNLTGLGVKITSVILTLSGGSLWPALLLTALACLILGMEVPTTAAYVICVSVAGPALQELGLAPLQAHPLRLLVRPALDHHTAGLRHGLHRRRHGRSPLAPDRRPGHAARPRPLSGAPRLHRPAGPDRSIGCSLGGALRLCQGRLGARPAGLGPGPGRPAALWSARRPRGRLGRGLVASSNANLTQAREADNDERPGPDLGRAR